MDGQLVMVMVGHIGDILIMVIILIGDIHIMVGDTLIMEEATGQVTIMVTGMDITPEVADIILAVATILNMDIVQHIIQEDAVLVEVQFQDPVEEDLRLVKQLQVQVDLQVLKRL